MAVLAPGYAPKFQTFQAGPGMKPLEVVLTRASLLRLQVRDSEQRPVPGAIVKAESWHNSPLLTWWKQTDAEGRCTWDAPPGDRVQFMITASNYFSARTEVMTAREAVLSVRKISRVFGKVADAETGRPVDEFRIIRGRSYSPGEPIRWERYNTTRGQGGEYSVRLDDNGSGQMEVLIEAPGYLPGTSPALTKPGWYTNDFLLHKGKGVSGVVRSAKGDLVGNATVILVDSSENAYMNEPGQFQSGGGNGDSVRTDAQGRFEFYPRLETDTVVVSHEQGFAEVRVRQMTTNAQVVLQPWGRVEGVLRVGRTVEPHQTVALNNGFSQGGEEGRSSPALSIYLRVDPDPQGKFVFEKVPPGERKVYLQYKFRDGPGQTPLSHGVPVLVQPGGTAEVTLGGSGRAVIGRVAVTGGEPDDVDWLRDVHTLSLRLPPRPAMQPVNVAGKTQEEQQKFWREYQEREQAFWRSEGGRALERAQRSYVLVFGSNATFRVDSVPPGTYDLMIRPTDPQYEYYNNQELGALSQEVVVPAAPAGRAGEPFDLGTVELRTKRIARVGRLAPSFEAKTVEGKVVKLEELRGKYVLLDFWAMWGGTRGSELQVLKGLHDTYGKEGRLVVIGLNLDGEAKPAAEFAKSNEMPWTQWYLGSWGQTPVPALFGVDGVPHAILLDPAGKIVAKNLRGSTIRSAVRNALGESQKAVSR